MNDLWLVLPINPEPWKVGPLSVIRKSGKYIPIVGRDQQLHAFKAAIAEQVNEKIAGRALPLFNDKVKLTLFLWRDRAEYSTPQARTHRKHEADATNMLKATEDALQGILYGNDKDNRDVRSVVVEQDPDVKPRIVIHVESWVGLNPDEIPSLVWAEIDGQPGFEWSSSGQ